MKKKFNTNNISNNSPIKKGTKYLFKVMITYMKRLPEVASKKYAKSKWAEAVTRYKQCGKTTQSFLLKCTKTTQLK